MGTWLTKPVHCPLCLYVQKSTGDKVHWLKVTNFASNRLPGNKKLHLNQHQRQVPQANWVSAEIQQQKGCGLAH